LLVSPAGYEFQKGNSNNTYPLGRVSASYQQIHDAVDMAALNGGQSVILTGMQFRPAQAYTITARTLEAQITLSATTKTAATMSTTFSANFGSKSTVVLPYTKVALPAGKGINGNPNAILWKFPFKTIYPYSHKNGNLLWDWRHKNSTSGTSAFFDFVSNIPTTATIASVGTGCTATGQTSPATASIVTSGSNYVARLSNARANSPAFAAVGLTRAPRSLWCGTLYIVPLIVLGGTTDATGTWDVATAPTSVLLGSKSYSEAFMQYAFADAGVAGGIGLSNYAVAAPPAHGKKYIERLWRVSGTNGAETATTGSKSNSGLITTFRAF
jgi:hypothetical protein